MNGIKQECCRGDYSFPCPQLPSHRTSKDCCINKRNRKLEAAAEISYADVT